MALKTCARCRNDAPEKRMTRLEVGRGLFQFFCPSCTKTIEARKKEHEANEG